MIQVIYNKAIITYIRTYISLYNLHMHKLLSESILD